MEQQGECSWEKKYKGVRKRKWGKWVSEIRLPNSRERIWLGSFDSPEKAARAFDAALFCLRGPRASFNFPSDPKPQIPGRFLSPPEIQAIATAFANQEQPASSVAEGDNNSAREGIQSGNSARDENQTAAQEDFLSGSFGGGVAIVTRGESERSETPMDWSFLDVLDSSVGPNEFGYFHHVLDNRSHHHHHGHSSDIYNSRDENTAYNNSNDMVMNEIFYGADIDGGYEDGFSQGHFLWNF